MDIISREINGLEDKVLVFVSNNGSSDGTREYLESLDYKWLHVRHNKENVGSAIIFFIVLIYRLNRNSSGRLVTMII